MGGLNPFPFVAIIGFSSFSCIKAESWGTKVSAFWSTVWGGHCAAAEDCLRYVSECKTHDSVFTSPDECQLAVHTWVVLAAVLLALIILAVWLLLQPFCCCYKACSSLCECLCCCCPKCCSAGYFRANTGEA